MSIRRHENGLKDYWIIDYYPHGRNGKRERIPFEGTFEAAQNAEREYRQINTISVSVNPKIRDILAEYLIWHKMKRKPTTHADTVYCFEKQLLDHFGNLPVNKITHSHIDSYHAKRGKPCSSNKELSYLGALIKWMVKRKYCKPLPFEIEKMEYTRPLPKVPTPNEFDAFMEAVRTGYKNSAEPKENRDLKEAALFIMYHAGLRINEIRLTTWPDIDLPNQTIYLGSTKNGEPRFALIPREAQAILKKYKKESGHVFINARTEKPYISLKSVFKGASKRAGIKVKGPHTLRHAHGANMINATGDIRATQVSLGHKDLKSTQIYTQIALDRQREQAKKTRDYVDRKRTRRPATKAT